MTISPAVNFKRLCLVTSERETNTKPRGNHTSDPPQIWSATSSVFEMKAFLFVSLCLTLAAAHIYFQETFDNGIFLYFRFFNLVVFLRCARSYTSLGNWESRWVQSQVKDADGTSGTWKITAGQWYHDAKEDQGLQTAQDARFYIASAPIEEFTNKGKDLILQYQVKHEQKIDCGGGYIKLLPKDSFTDATKFSPDSNYKYYFYDLPFLSVLVLCSALISAALLLVVLI